METSTLSKAILNFDKYITQAEQDQLGINFEPKNVIMKLIKYLQFGFSNKAQKETMTCTLQTLIKMIDRENKEEREKLQVLKF